MGAAASLVMSATTFAGSAQFAAASVLSGAGGAGAAATAAILLNGRYLPIGISVASAIRGRVPRRLAEAQAVVDESWAFSRRPDGTFDRAILIGAGLVLYACWNAGTAAGAFGGKALGNPESLGLDAAFAALFLALLVSQVHSRRAVSAAACRWDSACCRSSRASSRRSSFSRACARRLARKAIARTMTTAIAITIQTHVLM